MIYFSDINDGYMIKTALIYLILDSAITAFFDNVQKNFSRPINDKLYIPDNLISGCRCDVCIVNNSVNIPVGTKVTGHWHHLIFNGFDIDTGYFYFMNEGGDWIDVHVDNIVTIVAYDDNSDDAVTLQNNMYSDDLS